MLYSITMTIPANTPILTPTRATLKVSEGVIERVWVRWRWGSANLCGVRMMHQEFQYWPMTGSEWFPSSVHPFEFAESLDIVDEIGELVIEGYNLDDTYPHTVWVAFDIIRKGGDPILLAILNVLRQGSPYG